MTASDPGQDRHFSAWCCSSDSSSPTTFPSARGRVIACVFPGRSGCLMIRSEPKTHTFLIVQKGHWLAAHLAAVVICVIALQMLRQHVHMSIEIYFGPQITKYKQLGHAAKQNSSTEYKCVKNPTAVGRFYALHFQFSFSLHQWMWSLLHFHANASAD